MSFVLKNVNAIMKSKGGFHMKYEYKVEIVKGGILGLLDDSKGQTKQLNQAGAEGWKLILISEGKKFLKYVYIREVK